MEEIVTCINCPVGCRMTVSLSDEGEFLSVTGNTCPRGAAYARQECILPQRMLTAVIPVAGRETPLPVKTSRPVPKSMIFLIMKELGRLSILPPVSIGQVVLPDVLDTGADIIATRKLE